MIPDPPRTGNHLPVDAPLIGITMDGRDAAGRYALAAELVACVRRAGGIAVAMPPGDPRLEEWVETLDGLLLPPGGDIAPELYDADPHPSLGGVDRERDQDEVALVHLAVETELPLLAICRGMQVVNIAFGGDLFADLPAGAGEAVVHGGGAEASWHEVVIDPGSRLAGVLGSCRVRVPSAHHQAIDELGDGLEVVAHAADGVIEAVEAVGHPWLVAVQWQPQRAAAAEPMHQRLFDALVAAARGE